MSGSTLFAADHQGFYKEGERFYPLIQEADLPLANWSNVQVIYLPAGLDQDLNWSSAKSQAEEAIRAGKYLLWEIDLGLSSFTWKPNDLTSFQAFSIALDQFCSTILSDFKDKTFGVSLYRGDVDCLRQFPLLWWDSAYQEWLKEAKSDRSDAYEVFCLNIISDYLHRLVSILPAEVIVFALFDVTRYIHFAQVAHLFLQERFEFISLGLKGAMGPHSGLCWESGEASCGYWGREERARTIPSLSTVGLLLPTEEFWTSSLVDEVQRVCLLLQRANIHFRVVPESKLTEQWNDLDYLCVASPLGVTTQTQRKLQGFLAAGGRVINDREIGCIPK